MKQLPAHVIDDIRTIIVNCDHDLIWGRGPRNHNEAFQRLVIEPIVRLVEIERDKDFVKRQHRIAELLKDWKREMVKSLNSDLL